MGNEEDFSDKYSADISMAPYLAFYARDGTLLKANARNWKKCVGAERVVKLGVELSLLK